MKLPFRTAFSITENAARILAEERPSASTLSTELTLEQRCNLRTITRRDAVAALRWLWQTGDAGQRCTVACRVNVWLDRSERWAGAARILARENARRRDGSLPAKTRHGRVLLAA